jgi:hypothetical protein
MMIADDKSTASNTHNADERGNTHNNGSKARKGKRNIYKLDPTDVIIGDFHITMNSSLGKVDAVSLLEKLHDIRNDSSLTSEEKADKVQQLINNLQI